VPPRMEQFRNLAGDRIDRICRRVLPVVTPHAGPCEVVIVIRPAPRSGVRCAQSRTANLSSRRGCGSIRTASLPWRRSARGHRPAGES
jgi:hypothetical protein